MSDVTARIVLWGIEGAGKTTTLNTIYSRLRSDLRGELRREPSRLDPTVYAEALPITLGQVGGVGTAIEILAVPGGEGLEITRKQLLDRVDGVVLVLDCSPERIEANWKAIDELRSSLADYGRALDEIPMVLQYNKRDIADPFAIEDLHRRIGLEQSAVFETIATSGHGILAALTTISKHVVRSRRNQAQAPSETRSETTAAADPSTRACPPDSAAGLSPTAAPAASPSASPSASPAPSAQTISTHEMLEAAILAEGEAVEDAASGSEGLDLELSPAWTGSEPQSATQPRWDRASAGGPKPESALSGELRIVSAGQSELDGEGSVRIPLVLGDARGSTRSVVLSLRLESLLDESDD